MHDALSLLFLMLAVCGEPQEAASAPERPPNVLFIAVDDLRPALGCYGDERARTPHIDALAASGVVFERAYCVQSHCAPSRASVLTGRRPRPETLGDLTTEARELRVGTATLPELFQRRGYETVSLGKVEHAYGGEPSLRGWSVRPWRPEGRVGGYASPETEAAFAQAVRELGLAPDGAQAAQLRARFRSWEAPDVEDEALPDGVLATRAIAELERLRDAKFFLAVGFVKPHLPLVAPKRYWELYPADGLAPDPSPAFAEGVPVYAMHDSGELRSYWDVPDEGPIDAAAMRTVVHGYYACASYIDAQIGRVLAALERLDLAQRTIVVLWSDHGYQLGDLGLWGKHTNYELAVRVPLVVRAPGLATAGVRATGPVELFDLYPTLAELCGLGLPRGCDGTSLVRELRGDAPANERAAFHSYPGSGAEGAGIVGYAIRTGRHRLVDWIGADGESRARELYDYGERGEALNLAGREDLRELEESLSIRLREVWKPAAREGAAAGGGR